MDFNNRFRDAVNAFYKADQELLDSDFDINERTVTHRLGYFLTTAFLDYDVDCEYNRMVNKAGYFTRGDYWAKSVNIEIEGHISGDDTEAKTVYPDIIIHKRKTRNNLAVVEVKLSWKNAKKDFDYRKLRAYKKDLGYMYAIYLELASKDFIFDYI